ncbi:MAG: hypothetical protein NZ516_02565 [Raineya sp.]|nr:hypothetical protein [Raineya sp.]
MKFIILIPLIAQAQNDSALVNFAERKAFFKITLQPSLAYTMNFENQGDFVPLKRSLTPTFQGGVSVWRKVKNYAGINVGLQFCILNTLIKNRDANRKSLPVDYLWLGNYLQIPVSFRQYVPLKKNNHFWFWEIGANYQRHQDKLVLYESSFIESSVVLYNFRAKIDMAYDDNTNQRKNRYFGVFGGVGRSFFNKNGIFLEGAILLNYTFNNIGTGEYQVQTNEGKSASGKLQIFNHYTAIQLTYGF